MELPSRNAVTARTWFSLAGPPLIPVKPTTSGVELATTILFVIGSKVGGSFTGSTVSRKLLVFVASPSLTNNVIKVVPFSFVLGKKLMERFAPLPLIARLFEATSTRLDEVAQTANPVGSVSKSPTAKAKAA